MSVAAMSCESVRPVLPFLREADDRPETVGDEWLGTLSHELRSPLAAILSALEVIAVGDKLDPAARKAQLGNSC